MTPRSEINQFGEINKKPENDTQWMKKKDVKNVPNLRLMVKTVANYRGKQYPTRDIIDAR